MAKINGTDGADYLQARPGDVVDGGAGDDRLVLDFDGASERIVFVAPESPALWHNRAGVRFTNIEEFSITGGKGDDLLTGSSGSDRFEGGSGRDVLYGGAGLDELHGGRAADLLDGGGGGDYLYGDSGADVIHGGSGADYIVGGTGNDRLYGGSGSDLLTHRSGEDGRDHIDGGSGRDTLSLQLADTGLAAAAPGATTTLADGTTITNIERYEVQSSWSADAAAKGPTLITSDGADTVTTDWNAGLDGFVKADDTVRTAGGVDIIHMTWGSDRVDAGSGDDYVELFCDGTDRVEGGAGNDKIWVGSTVNPSWFKAGDIVFSADADGATLTHRGDASRYTGFETYELYLDGGGNDNVRLDGDARLIVHAGGGKDTLSGGDAGDTLWGGTGHDVLTGGAGNDTFGLDTRTADADRIVDFTRGHDTLALFLEDFDPDEPVDLTPLLRVGAGHAASGSHSQLLFDTATHQLWYDDDGALSGSDTVLCATLEGVDTLSLGDFMFIQG